MPKRHSQSSPSTAGTPPKRRSQDANSSGRDTTNSTTTNQPNFESSCPYQILGVPRNATIQQIKLSYRKLALKHHPDRQSSEADKDTAHHIFSSIGHAYEILSDTNRKREYDEGLQQEQYQQQNRGRGGFGHDPFDHFFSSPFGFGFGGNTQSSRQRSNQPSDFHNFTDPFQLFEQFFAEELERNNNNSQRQQQRQQSGIRSDPFASDPFFSDPFFSSAGMTQGVFGQSSIMSPMMNTQHGSMHESMHNQQLMGGGGGMSSSSFFSSSSSSSHHGGGRGQSVSTSTRTTIVNGVRQTVTERTITHPDGRVERHVTTDGGNNGGGRLASQNNPVLDYDRGRSR